MEQLPNKSGHFALCSSEILTVFHSLAALFLIYITMAWGDLWTCLGFSLSWFCPYIKNRGLYTSCFCPSPTPNIQGTSVLEVLSLSSSGPQPSAVSPIARHVLHPFPCSGSITQCLRPKEWIAESHVLILIFWNVSCIIKVVFSKSSYFWVTPHCLALSPASSSILFLPCVTHTTRTKPSLIITHHVSTVFEIAKYFNFSSTQEESIMCFE